MSTGSGWVPGTENFLQWRKEGGGRGAKEGEGEGRRGGGRKGRGIQRRKYTTFLIIFSLTKSF